MENKSALVVDEVDESKDIMEIEQIVSNFYTTERIRCCKSKQIFERVNRYYEYFKPKRFNKNSHTFCIQTALIGEKGSRVERLQQISLKNQFSIKFTIDFHPSYISKVRWKISSSIRFR